MNLLTDDEIYSAYIKAANQTLRPQDDRIALAFARAIIAATVAKLAAGVSVEPDFTDCKVSGYIGPGRMCGQVIVGDKSCGNRTSPCENKVPYYTATAIAAARVLALEEAAKIAETPICGEQDDITMEAKDRVATAIRALIGKEST